MGVDRAREFHVASVPRRSHCFGRRECRCRHRDRNHNKAWPKPILTAKAQLLESPHQQSSEGFWDFYIYMRRTVSFLFGGTLLVAGLALSVIGIVQAQGFMPFVFFYALILIAAGGVWLLGKFVLTE
jgi:hypothetical protein